MEKSSIILSTEGVYRILSSEIYDILNKRHFQYKVNDSSLKTKYKHFYIKDNRLCVKINEKLAGNCPDYGILQLYIDLLKNRH